LICTPQLERRRAALSTSAAGASGVPLGHQAGRNRERAGSIWRVMSSSADQARQTPGRPAVRRPSLKAGTNVAAEAATKAVAAVPGRGRPRAWGDPGWDKFGHGSRWEGDRPTTARTRHPSVTQQLWTNMTPARTGCSSFSPRRAGSPTTGRPRKGSHILRTGPLGPRWFRAF